MIDRLLIIKVQHTLAVNPLILVVAHFVVVRRLAVQSVLDFAARTFEVVFAVILFDSKYVVAVGSRSAQELLRVLQDRQLERKPFEPVDVCFVKQIID